MWAWRNCGVWRVVGAQVVTFSALYFSLLSLAGRIALYEDASPMFMALRPHLRSDDRFVQYQMAPQFTSVFYLGRPTEFMNFLNNSGLDNKAITASRLFRPGRRCGKPLVRRPAARFHADTTASGIVPLPRCFTGWRNNDF